MWGIYYMEAAEKDYPTAAKDDQSDEMTISMHALSGVRTTATLSLATTVAIGQLSALVDLGSTHCFIALDTVGVANVDRIPMVGICKVVPITIHSKAFTVDLYAIDLHGYEMVLGCDWLSTLRPIL
jgi:hypothetical protein